MTRNKLRFHEYEIDGSYQTESGSSMIPMQLFVLENQVGNQGEHHQRDALLNDLELHQIERATVIHKAETVGWHLTAIFEKGDCPREGDNQIERPVG